MKQYITITLVIITAILSMFPVSLSAGAAGSPTVITLQKHPKPNGPALPPDPNGHRTPSTPVTVYFSKGGLYSPYFDTDEVISFAIIDDTTGQSVFMTDDVEEFSKYLLSCRDMVWVQFELEEYYIDGWINIDQTVP